MLTTEPFSLAHLATLSCTCSLRPPFPLPSPAAVRLHKARPTILSCTRSLLPPPPAPLTAADEAERQALKRLIAAVQVHVHSVDHQAQELVILDQYSIRQGKAQVRLVAMALRR